MLETGHTELLKLNCTEEKDKVLLTPSHQWSHSELRGLVLIATGEKGIRL